MHLTTKNIAKMSALAIFTLAITIATNVEATNITSPSYAWSESVGWIKFDTGPGDITVSNTGITGHAYNDNIGWILLDGVSNDGAGNLSGYAWSESVGYLDFSQVTIENNQFHGFAYNDNIGFISFNCANTDTCGDVDYKVSTTWKQASPRRSSGGGGTTAQSRITNLERAGNLEQAEELRQQFNLSPTQPSEQPQPQTPTTQLSLPQIVELLISIGIIEGDRVEQARQAIQTLTPSQTPTPTPTITAPTPQQTPSSRFQFTRDLQLNDTGTEVIALQQFLKHRNYLVNSNSGEPGSLGNETAFFGEQTKQALIRYQQANNITPADGTFRESTRVIANPTIR